MRGKATRMWLRPDGKPWTHRPCESGIKLDFFTPFEGHNAGRVHNAAAGDATNVNMAHAMAPRRLRLRLIHVVHQPDNMISRILSAGLARPE